MRFFLGFVFFFAFGFSQAENDPAEKIELYCVSLDGQYKFEMENGYRHNTLKISTPEPFFRRFFENWNIEIVLVEGVSVRVSEFKGRLVFNAPFDVASQAYVGNIYIDSSYDVYNTPVRCVRIK